MNILILGGTKQARLLAEQLSKQHYIVYAIAGVTTKAQLPANIAVKSGGFGGALGLAHYIQNNQFDICIDATHPFATQITQNAIKAAEITTIKLLHLTRLAWVEGHDDHWTEFTNITGLIEKIQPNARLLLAIGRQHIAAFTKLNQSIIARMIEAPNLQSLALPNSFSILLARPPFSIEDEIKLLKKHDISHIICKNSGGKLDAKLIAARQLGLPVLMLKAPEQPILNAYHSIELLTEALNGLIINNH